MENIILSHFTLEEIADKTARKVFDRIIEDRENQGKSKNEEDEGTDILSFEEGCKILRIAKPTGYSKVSKREIPFMKRGKFIYFSKKELFKWLKEGRRKTVFELESKK
ncbi:hypothetical protein MASR2M41_26760 [Flammeovirgaceae bacterium]